MDFDDNELLEDVCVRCFGKNTQVHSTMCGKCEQEVFVSVGLCKTCSNENPLDQLFDGNCAPYDRNKIEQSWDEK